MANKKDEKYIESTWYEKKITAEALNKFIAYVSEHYVSFNLNELESLSFSNTDVIFDQTRGLVKIRVKLFEKDQKTPRIFKLLNKETKELREANLEEVIKTLNSLGFEKSVFDLETKLSMFDEYKKASYNKKD